MPPPATPPGQAPESGEQPESAVRTTRRRLLANTGALLLGAAAVGLGFADARSKTTGGAGPRDRLHMLVPAAPGGGWDTVAREVQAVAQEHALTDTIEVLNVPGAAGTIGLARLINQVGRGDTLMMTGTVMMGGIETTGSPNTLRDATPIARLADDYAVLAVPADSPAERVEDLLDAWRADTAGVVVGGGSVGGTDHLLAGMLSGSAGAQASELNYIPYAGGGEAVAGALNGSLDAIVSGYTELSEQLKTGQLRALGISAPQRIPEIDIAPFREHGVDVELANWRGLFAPPGLDPEQRAELEQLTTEIHDTPEWQDTLTTNIWQDTFQIGDEFEGFVDTETSRIQRISRELGLS
ncbi:tripartite tricarboxylate transporter substrate binding protein [Saccharopolyspora sp. HNM0983]|uniref:Tripartite tricarboxylate transporter substrate binding protein n=1 Tax=Saccharopolyspora montiporae TaxID=2781240 RepID=A0A929B8U6_9PSEU|nr:tripartite tricarboxylate transporter substrate-binding protein [Saccharopolyspora sp. HNM0983]MBE9375404.1 tripartite tricarboxylate transporter substrate binding protein [Saccharopolyspora sp. HNM0983]